MTYSELQAQVIAWMARDDIDEAVKDYISLAEKEINRILRVQDQEDTIEVAGDDTDRYSLPVAAKGWRSISVDSVPMAFATPAQRQIWHRTAVDGQGNTLSDWGVPWAYTIEGDEIVFNGAVSVDSVIQFLGYNQVPALSDLNPTNWLLDEQEDVYFWGALKYAHLKARNTEEAAAAEGLFREALSQVTEADTRDRWSGRTLAIRSDTQMMKRHRRRYPCR